jgi:hypothetical protein
VHAGQAADQGLLRDPRSTISRFIVRRRAICTPTLSIVALVVGALGLAAGVAALALSRRRGRLA